LRIINVYSNKIAKNVKYPTPPILTIRPRRFAPFRPYLACVCPPPKTARIHGISGCTKYLLKGPIREKKMATPGELHHPHNQDLEIQSGTKTSISRQYDEIIIRPTILWCREYISDYGNKKDSQPENTFG